MASSPNSPSPDLGSLRIHEGQRKGRKTGKVFATIGALLGVLMVVAGGVLAFRNQTPVVEVAVAQKAGTGRAALLNASGCVTPRRRATIAAKITGRVTAVNFDEGMHVREGYVLATLAFAFRITPILLGIGILFALFMGLIGGVPPAIRAASRPPAFALREL
jgi:multidrug efflux pump subunit AcrA (membrane-fusion protein)